MRKSFKILSLFVISLTLLSGCSSSNTSEIDSEINNSSEEIDSYMLHGSVSNFISGPLQGVEVNLSFPDRSPLTVETNSNGEYVFDEVNSLIGASLSVEKYGYRLYEEILTSNNDLINIELSKNANIFGSLVYKNWAKYEAFDGYVTRNSAGIEIILNSDNQVFFEDNRDSRIEIAISTKETSYERNENVTLLSFGKDLEISISSFNNRTIDISNYKPIAKDLSKNDKSEIEIFVPYVNLNATSEEIMGVSMRLYNQTYSSYAEMYMKGSGDISNIEDPTQYVRFDKDNFTFVNEKNCYKEEMPLPDFDKQALIAGHNINFAYPGTSNKKKDADDIYVKVNQLESSYKFEMVGFGVFKSSEYIKMILHTSSINGTGWAIQSSDITFMIDAKHAVSKTGLTDFWAYSNFLGNEKASNHQPIYEAFNGYFTLDFEVDTSEIPNYSKEGKLALGLWEFGSGVIYDATPYTDAMFYNGKAVGDLAFQSTYVDIHQKELSVNKDEILSSYPIEFSIGADDIYVKTQRNETTLDLNFVSFNSLADYSFIRFIVKSSSTTYSGWGMDSSDVSFMIYKNIAYVARNKTNFWDDEASNFHSGETTNHVPNFSIDESGDFWTLALSIDYDEIGNEVNSTSPLSGLFIEFAPSIQNNGFKQNGILKGDIADQKNYFTL